MIYDEEVLPEEIKTERQVTGPITISILIGMLLGASIGYLMMQLITPLLQIPFIIGNVLIGGALAAPYKRFNPKKRLIRSLWFMLNRPKETYYPIEIDPEPIEEETDYDSEEDSE